jgi:hypothetical protein
MPSVLLFKCNHSSYRLDDVLCPTNPEFHGGKYPTYTQTQTFLKPSSISIYDTHTHTQVWVMTHGSSVACNCLLCPWHRNESVQQICPRCEARKLDITGVFDHKRIRTVPVHILNQLLIDY